MMKSKLKLIWLVISLLLIWISLIIFFGCDWAKESFAFVSFDEVLFTLTSSVLNAGQNLIPDFFKKCVMLPTFIVVFIALIIYFYTIYTKKYNIELKVEIKKVRKQLNFDLFNNKVFKLIKLLLCCLPLIIFVGAFIKFGDDLYFFDYLKYQSVNSSFLEENYINPVNVDLKFPEEKRNLIYIFVESMEMTYSEKDSGGAYEINYIPELTKIAEDNINFSNSDLLGGAYTMSGATWTIAGMAAQTAGIPIKTIFDGNLLTNYYDVLFPGAYSIGEILADNGYKNYLMFGSDASFGGRDNYFTYHGNYEIYDYYQAIDDEFISEDYYVFWGFEDDKLFEYVKEKLLDISEGEEPFNFTMLTVDTHSPDGYLSDFCEVKYDNEYLNAVACSDMQVAEFIEWIMDQDFYENTTIVIVGDHLSMNTYSFDDIGDYQRTIYNAFINSAVEAEDEDNYKNRIFTSFDFYPTTLAALGVNISGNKLGLGTNLFSDKQTIVEEYGYGFVLNELSLKSKYYDSCIINGNC